MVYNAEDVFTWLSVQRSTLYYLHIKKIDEKHEVMQKYVYQTSQDEKELINLLAKTTISLYILLL